MLLFVVGLIIGVWIGVAVMAVVGWTNGDDE